MTSSLLVTDTVQILCSLFSSSPRAITLSVASAHTRFSFTTHLEHGKIFAEQKPNILQATVTSLQRQESFNVPRG